MLREKQTLFKLGEGRMIAEETPRRVFEVSVTVGPVTIHGLIVWRSKNGHLRVFWPQHKSPAGFNIWQETAELDPELRESIEAAVIAAYRESKGLPPRKPAPTEIGLDGLRIR